LFSIEIAYLMCHQNQTSAQNGISPAAYLNLKLNFAVLCRNNSPPTHPPIHPPSAPIMISTVSGTRRRIRTARQLSSANSKNVTPLKAANHPKANES
jgi:hypothetical protein